MNSRNPTALVSLGMRGIGGRLAGKGAAENAGHFIAYTPDSPATGTYTVQDGAFTSTGRVTVS